MVIPIDNSNVTTNHNQVSTLGYKMKHTASATIKGKDVTVLFDTGAFY